MDIIEDKIKKPYSLKNRHRRNLQMVDDSSPKVHPVKLTTDDSSPKVHPVKLTMDDSSPKVHPVKLTTDDSTQVEEIVKKEEVIPIISEKQSNISCIIF